MVSLRVEAEEREMNRPIRFAYVACLAVCAAVCAAGCGRAGAAEGQGGFDTSAKTASASAAFWRHWGDGNAELSGYRLTTRRYGELRSGTAVLVFVTEPLDAKTLIKNDGVSGARKLSAIKLNHMQTFNTGIYPYSLMTSVFVPVDAYRGRHRFSPVKIAFSGQEWCGHVYQKLRIEADSFRDEIRSYFASEGERSTQVAAKQALYEDALLIQLRELDGAFNGGKAWSGQIVRSLWSARKAHSAVRPVQATISRSSVTKNGIAATRFVLKYSGKTRSYFIEAGGSKRVLGWQSSDGEEATLLKTARLPYWQLSRNQDQSVRQKIGL
jgi:hypothetical protein